MKSLSFIAQLSSASETQWDWLLSRNDCGLFKSDTLCFQLLGILAVTLWLFVLVDISKKVLTWEGNLFVEPLIWKFLIHWNWKKNEWNFYFKANYKLFLYLILCVLFLWYNYSFGNIVKIFHLKGRINRLQLSKKKRVQKISLF